MLSIALLLFVVPSAVSWTEVLQEFGYEFGFSDLFNGSAPREVLENALIPIDSRRPAR